MTEHLEAIEARDVERLLRQALSTGCDARGLIKGNDDYQGLLGVLVPKGTASLLTSEVDRAVFLEAALLRACAELPGAEALLGLNEWARSTLSERRAAAHGAPPDDRKAADTFRKHRESNLLLDIAIELLFDLSAEFAIMPDADGQASEQGSLIDGR